MQERKVKVTYEAIYDIVETEEYIRYRFDEARALRYRREIYKEIQALSTNASMFRPTGISYRGYEIYKKNFSPGIIFWIIKNDEVHILRVTREEFNWQRFFENHQDYKYNYPETN